MRTDVHRPSVINPADYDYVAPEHVKIMGLDDCYFAMAMRKRILEHMARTGGTYANHEHGGNCMVCGNVFATYTILFYHRPTNTYVRMGCDCADKASLGYDRREFGAFAKNTRDSLVRVKALEDTRAFLTTHGFDKAWELYEARESEIMKAHKEHVAVSVLPYEEKTIISMVERLVNNRGDANALSEKAMIFMSDLITKIADREIAAAREALEPKEPCPTGRVLVSGTVVGMKTYESAWGINTKILVKSDKGFKVWVSRFNSVEKGDHVTFKATLEPSKDDAYFGFGSRPHVPKDSSK